MLSSIPLTAMSQLALCATPWHPQSLNIIYKSHIRKRKLIENTLLFTMVLNRLKTLVGQIYWAWPICFITLGALPHTGIKQPQHITPSFYSFIYFYLCGWKCTAADKIHFRQLDEGLSHRLYHASHWLVGCRCSQERHGLNPWIYLGL